MVDADARLAIPGAGAGGGGDLAVVPAPAGLRGAAGALAAERGRSWSRRSLAGLALALFLVHDLLRWLARPSGWAERYLEMPAPVARQLGRAGRFLVVAAAVLLLPVYLFDHGLIAPEGRPLHAPAFGRFLILAFELVVWGTCVRLLRGRSPLCLVRDRASAIRPAR